LEEARYYLILTRDLGYADVSLLKMLIEEVSKLLEGYSHALKMPASSLLNTVLESSILNTGY